MLKSIWNDSLNGKKVIVQGVGQVGKYLVERLIKEGAQVFVTDIFEDKLMQVAKATGATAINPADVYSFDADIYAPCALGATLNDETIPQLKVQIVAGAANNQLKDDQKHGLMLMDRGITYAPDFLINAGGVINVYAEFIGGYNKDVAYAQTEKIYDTCLDILNKAEKENIPAQEAAMQLALKRINDMGKVKLSY